jgi:multimeric flavodoxin WrbA
MRALGEGTRRATIIAGSARSDGNTGAAVAYLLDLLEPLAQVADLSALTIAPYDYSRCDDRDDFQSVIRMILGSEHVVFATPVYWYSMSGVMKVFFDRLTDLLDDPDSRKTARALAGRSAWLLATGTDDGLPPGFHEPFARTAAYFGMIWRNVYYCRSIQGAPLSIESLSEIDQMARLIAG